MDSTPLVSVIIPTYNRAVLLQAAVRSVLAQTMPHLEVLVCDDGSTDHSRELVEALGDARVRWVQGPRGGRPAIPRNEGLRQAQGTWVAFLDSDDLWEPRKLELQFQALHGSGCLASCTNALRIAPHGMSLGSYFPHFPDRRWTRAQLLWCNQVICSSALVHRSLLERTGSFAEDPELIAIEDYDLWLRVATLSDFLYLSEPLVRYLDAPAQSIRSEQKLRFAQQMRLILQRTQAWSRSQGLPSLGLMGCLRTLALKVRGR